ncbi:ornithine cyclodeaminase family protein [Shewanella submarina]|uniref:Ornithine cyclodeaminase family protein n=1 Tax=Shewanella submarina TaxID=2016376 RepID=A0ABV7GLW1_9GAMM|nr:ornithine cyclodeaminase family protein [Shewanella submarina]MCL1035754.1 ornithine cyclodeaminase family protein [Shewanella submarina]
MKIIDKQQVVTSLNYDALLPALKKSFGGSFSMPRRQVFELAPGDPAHNAFAVLPAWDEEVIGVKSFTYFPENARDGYDSLYSKIMLFDRRHGVPLALVDGTSVTLWRTSAVSALAADFLARPDAKHLVFFGTGNLASYMIKAHLSVRDYNKVTIIARNADKVSSLVARLSEELPDISFVSGASTQEIISSADTISCATGSPEPLFNGDWLSPGTHVDLIGNHHAHYRECDTATLVRSRVYVDSKTNVLNEAGELLIPIAEGVFEAEQICGEMADLCASQVGGRTLGRKSDEEITLFKSVGTALSDLVAANLVYKLAARFD